MVSWLRPSLALLFVAALGALPACSTQEISAGPVVIPDPAPSADHGALQIAFVSREASFAEQQANASAAHTTGHVFLDGGLLAWLSVADGSLQPFVVTEGGIAGIGYVPAGTHHFEIKAAASGVTLFAGDGEISPGSTTELFLFSAAGAMQGRFVSYPDAPPPGTAHVSLINLVRSGQSIEVVGCMDASHCAPLSPPLALGETFAADFPMDATQDWPNGRYILSNGAGLAYRQVPTIAVSDPPVQPASRSVLVPVDGSLPSGVTLVGAPIYMSPAGDIQASF